MTDSTPKLSALHGETADPPSDPDVAFLLNYAATLQRLADESRLTGKVFGPECADVQVPIFERIADRLASLVASRETAVPALVTTRNSPPSRPL